MVKNKVQFSFYTHPDVVAQVDKLAARLRLSRSATAVHLMVAALKVFEKDKAEEGKSNS
jgi:hypothetical protein